MPWPSADNTIAYSPPSDTSVSDSSGSSNDSMATASLCDANEYVDPVHGRTRFPDIVWQIIQTPQFQRLRNVKQLGTCSFVFSDATHTRYEHCIGVCQLAMRFLATLEANSLEPARTDEFYEFCKTCVILAGLLHDIGHGPFSHMWEPFVHSGTDKCWAHETASGHMLRHLFDVNRIRLSDDDKKHECGLRLIVACIVGTDESTFAEILGDELHYMSEIINNKYCLIDVDKWDYLLRDPHYLPVQVSAELDAHFGDCFWHARIVVEPERCRRSCTHSIERDGQTCRTHVAFHEKTMYAVRALFDNRARLHRTAYQQKDVVGNEIILRRIFQLAEEAGFLFKSLKLSQCHRDMSVFQLLDDTILQTIEQSNNQRLLEAQRLASRFRSSQFSVDYDEKTHTVTVNVRNDRSNDNDGVGGESYALRLSLPDALGSLPKRILLFADDGWSDEVNPIDYVPRC